MKRIMTVLFAATMMWSLASLALAETTVQSDKEQKIITKVRQRSANQNVMPAPKEQLKRLSDGLKLTPEQKNQIKPMLSEEFEKLKVIRQDDNLNPKEIQVKVEALRSETATKIKTVLTAEQQATFDSVSKEIQANKHKRIKENRKSRIGNQAGEPSKQPEK